MLRRTRVCPRAVTPSLVHRAVLLRCGLLGLRCGGATNMCVLAAGPAEGLPRGARLEMYGGAARLALSPSSPQITADDLTAVAAAVEAAMTSAEAREGAAVVLAPLQTPPPDGVVAEWRITTQEEENKEGKQQQTSFQIMENGVIFESPHAAGLRVLRAARQTFGQLFLREISELAPLSSTGGTEPLAILDVSETDCAFSRVAIHVGVEAGLELERDFNVSYVPLTDAAAVAVDANLMSLLRLVARPNQPAQMESLRALQSRYFTLGCYTVGSRRCQERKESVGLHLAHVISKLRCGGTLLVNVAGSQSLEAAEECEKSDITLLQREVRTVITEALSRSKRWGVISDEVLPAADCCDAAVSLVVSLD